MQKTQDSNSNGGERNSMSKKLAVFIGATVTLLVGLALDQLIFHPLVDALSTALPCNLEGKWQESCINSKNLLILAPYVSTFGGIMVFLKKVGAMD